MDISTRNALKHEDAFARTTLTGFDWVQANRGRVIRITILALVVIAAIIVAAVVYSQRSTAAENALGMAMATYGTPIADPAQPVPPGVKTYASAAERAKAANPQFVDVAKRYGSMEAGENALYFSGLTYAEMGQNSQAETTLRKAAGVRNHNIAALGKLALANLLAQSGRNDEAIKLLQQLTANPTTTVPASTAQLALAAVYQTTNPTAANKIYTSLKDKDKTTAASSIAASRLAGGK
ncbi:MAG: tetratricopeptide repeat protein [Acidobacteriaceae bacterium]